MLIDDQLRGLTGAPSAHSPACRSFAAPRTPPPTSCSVGPLALVLGMLLDQHMRQRSSDDNQVLSRE